MKTSPYISGITYEQVWAYRPADPATYTPSPLVNAVANALYSTRYITANDIAEYLCIEERLLRAVVQVELGMTLSDLVHRYRIDQADQYIRVHPDQNLNQVAIAIGYSSDSTLWRFYQRMRKETPLGQKSQAHQELWLKWREERKKRKG